MFFDLVCFRSRGASGRPGKAHGGLLGGFSGASRAPGGTRLECHYRHRVKKCSYTAGRAVPALGPTVPASGAYVMPKTSEENTSPDPEIVDVGVWTAPRDGKTFLKGKG
jgi:hypothetical protein